jgi:hypothetical protein
MAVAVASRRAGEATENTRVVRQIAERIRRRLFQMAAPLFDAGHGAVGETAQTTCQSEHRERA